MAFYCGDCVTWINSRDADRYGRKYCDFSKRYEEKDQKIYGCRGFVWAKRSIITKVCEILGTNPVKYFQAFDDTKEILVVPSCIDELIDYNTVGPVIANRIDQSEKRVQMAQNILDNYIEPAYKKCEEKDYQGAVSIYEKMVKVLAVLFNATKERIAEDIINQSPISSDLLVDGSIRLK